MADINFKTIVVETGQCLADIAIQEYGNIAGVFIITEDNGIQSIDEVPQPGKELKIRTEIVTLGSNNKAIAKKFNTQAVKINTGNPFDTNTVRYVEENYVDNEYIIGE